MDRICFNNLYIQAVDLQPEELLHLRPGELEAKLIKKLRTNVEGRCNKHGLVLPGSVSVLSRTIGIAPNEQMNGFFVFRIKYQVRICNPPIGTVLPAKIITKNKMGLLTMILLDCEEASPESKHFLKYPINALLPYQIHNNVSMDIFQAMAVGDEIQVEVVGKKFDIPDRTISVLAKLLPL